MKVIGGVDSPLEQDPKQWGEIDLGRDRRGDGTHVFTAYLKNSVTSAVEPLRVIDWRIALDCFVGGMSVS